MEIDQENAGSCSEYSHLKILDCFAESQEMQSNYFDLIANLKTHLEQRPEVL
jgi:hypothetical protein